jgi:hypothetical protein
MRHTLARMIRFRPTSRRRGAWNAAVGGLSKDRENMTEPSTPTGRRLWPNGPVPEYMYDIARETRTNILAIESEARAQVRERLLERVRQERPRIRQWRGGARSAVRGTCSSASSPTPDQD